MVYINENSDSIIIIIPKKSTTKLMTLRKEVLLYKYLDDKIIPKKLNNKEMNEIVYRPFKNSGK
jgi:hypothetical protein